MSRCSVLRTRRSRTLRLLPCKRPRHTRGLGSEGVGAGAAIAAVPPRLPALFSMLLALQGLRPSFAPVALTPAYGDSPSGMEFDGKPSNPPSIEDANWGQNTANSSGKVSVNGV